MIDDDMIGVLVHDHREVGKLFDELGGVGPNRPERRRRLADRITIDLVRHSAVEEMYVYPAARRVVPSGEEFADREIAELERIEGTLKELERADAADERFGALMEQLARDVRDHVSEEEEQLFPELVERLDGEELAALGRRIMAAKEVAPTRPHPMSPGRPPLNKLLVPATGMVDRFRDLLSGRGA